MSPCQYCHKCSYCEHRFTACPKKEIHDKINTLISEIKADVTVPVHQAEYAVKKLLELKEKI